ncbi:hypothetical protein V9T40_002866 [Parthenolecanium corni]|uniref:Uncharacterized protein n=1 Tax=Parthenolecanium corni TaxID=536013 RepID=A0AAN9TGX6_9HEMI
MALLHSCRNYNLSEILYQFSNFQNDNMKSSMSGSLSGDEDHEINVDSGSEDYEEENEDMDEDMCTNGTDNETDTHTNLITTSSASSSPSSTLPFSISRLLGADKIIGPPTSHYDSSRLYTSEATALFTNPASYGIKSTSPESLIYSTAAGGVIKVPAHRPSHNSAANGPTLHQSPALGSPFPWLAMDPAAIMQRNAAAAMLVAKERLTGKSIILSFLQFNVSLL